MSLTPMQERYCLEVASGKSQAAAYRIAYPKSQKWKEKTVWARASELMADGKVSGRVSELRQEAAKKCILTRQEWLKRLKDISEVCDGCQYATKSAYGRSCDAWRECLVDLQKRERACRG